MIQFLCYDIGIFLIVCRNILPHCRNLYEIEGERDMLQICYRDIRNKAATATLVSSAMSVTPPCKFRHISYIHSKYFASYQRGVYFVCKIVQKPSSAQSICAFLGFLIVFQRRMIVMMKPRC